MEMEEVWFGLACVNAVCLYMAPILAFLLARSVVRYAPYPYLFTLVSLLLWMRYASDWGLDVLFRLSGFGTFTAAMYISAFLYLSERGDPRRTYFFQLARGGVALLVGAVGFDFVTPKTTFYNVVCCAAACFASAAPFYNLRRAWLARSMQTMPHVSLPILASTNAMLWIRKNIAGVAPEAIDYYLVFAAAVAGLCALLQLLLHALFWCLPPPPPPADELAVPFLHNNEGTADKSESDDDDSRGIKSNGSSVFGDFIFEDADSFEDDGDIFEDAHDGNVGEHPQNGAVNNYGNNVEGHPKNGAINIGEHNFGEHPENGVVNIGEHPANGAVNIGEHNVGHHPDNGAGNVHDHNAGHHLENGGENGDGHDLHANANDAAGEHSDCSEISLDDRDDVQADGYEPDSEGSGHHGPLGDPEDVYLVHVASSSDEEVAAQPPAVQQEPVAVGHHHVDIPDDAAV